MQAYEGKGNETNTQERGDSIMFEKISKFLDKSVFYIAFAGVSYFGWQILRLHYGWKIVIDAQEFFVRFLMVFTALIFWEFVFKNEKTTSVAADVVKKKMKNSISVILTLISKICKRSS